MGFGYTVFILLSVLGLTRSYTIIEMNSVILDFVITDSNNPTARLDQLQNGTTGGLTTKERLFDLIAEAMTTYCLYSSTQVTCQLETDHNRNQGDYARQIVDADYMVNRTNVKIFRDAETEFISKNDATHMTMVIYIITHSGLDYFRWTEVVRVVNANMDAINDKLIEEDYQSTGLLNTQTPPSSYVTLLITNNWQTSMIIAVVMLSAALIMFIVIVPLSRTDVCKPKVKSADEDEE